MTGLHFPPQAIRAALTRHLKLVSLSVKSFDK